MKDVKAVNVSGSDCLTASLLITGVDGASGDEKIGEAFNAYIIHNNNCTIICTIKWRVLSLVHICFNCMLFPSTKIIIMRKQFCVIFFPYI